MGSKEEAGYHRLSLGRKEVADEKARGLIDISAQDPPFDLSRID